MTHRWLLACAAVMLAAGVASAEQGAVRGTVVSVAPAQGEEGALALTLKGEGPWQAVLTVTPGNARALETVRGLKPGERVVVGWVTEGERQLVREIARVAEGEKVRAEGERADERREGEGEKVRAEGERDRVKAEGEKVRREGGDRELDDRALAEKRERLAREGIKEKARLERDGERIKEVPRDGERIKEGARDGERVKEVVRDGDRVKEGVRDGDRVKEGVRDGERIKEGMRDGERVKEGLRDGERVKEGVRDGERVKEGVRDGERVKEGLRDGERVKEGVRDGERVKEGAREEGPRMKALARVVSMETTDENTRVLKLAVVEGGEEMTFTVRANQGDLYGFVGNLKPGAAVRVAWKTEGGVSALTGITRAGEER